MKYAWADLYTIELPAGHRFPMDKYRLCRERLLAEGTIRAEQLLEPALCPRELLELVHTGAWIDRVFAGELSSRERREIGFPWSESLVRRSRCSVNGTVEAARRALADGAAGNFAGGTHHAFADRAAGFCLFNDIAVAIRAVQALEGVGRAAVVDCDVHQGDGTARIFRDDPSVFTLSLHGKNNWPFRKERSDLDVELEDGTGDAEYLEALAAALAVVGRFEPEIVLYQAGVDPLASDRLGKLSLSHAGLLARDRAVFSWARARGVPIAVCFGGGYAESIDDIVEAHANTFRVAEAHWPG